MISNYTAENESPYVAKVDIDSYMFRTAVWNLVHVLPRTVLLRPNQKRVGVDYIDYFTVQLNQDSISIHVPLTATIKRELMIALAALGTAIVPHSNPLILNSGSTPCPTERLQRALIQCHALDVFVCAYGQKLSEKEFPVVFHAHIQPWTHAFRRHFHANIPRTALYYDEAERMIMKANNVFHLGTTYYTPRGTFPTFYLGEGSRPGETRQRYHLLGPLSEKTDDGHHHHKFGSFTAHLHPLDTEGPTQITVYLGPLVKALRAGSLYSFPRNSKMLQTVKGVSRAVERIKETYEYLRIMKNSRPVHPISSKEPYLSGADLLCGFRTEVVIRCTKYVNHNALNHYNLSYLHYIHQPMKKDRNNHGIVQSFI